MMQTMREHTKWIMLVTALAFVALMVFEWGMDITGQSSGLTELGHVDGTPVMYEQYQFAYRNLYEQVQQSQDDGITSQQNMEIEQAAFDEVVTQILVQQELARRGIRVTSEEIRQAARFSPPPQYREVPDFQTDGVFDLQKYQIYLANTSESELLLLESYYRDVIPRSKLLRQVSAGIYIPDGALWSAWKDENEQVTVRSVTLDPATRVLDEEVEVTEAEITAYYREHEADFEVPARVRVQAVVLDQGANAADTAAARERATEIRQEIVDGADFAELARAESSDSLSAVVGGDLGTFGREDMVPPFDSVAFSATIGRIADPVQTQFGLHLIEVSSRTADSVTARHILIPIERTDASEIELLTRADSLEVLGENATLAEAARTLGLEVDTLDVTEDFPFIVGAGQIGEGSEWAFLDAEIGDVSPVFENRQAFYALELVDRQPEGVLPLEDARIVIEQTLRLEKKLGRTRADAERALADGGTLAEVADRLGATVERIPAFSRSDFVPGLGRQNAVLGTAFGLEPGEVSEVIETNGRAFVIEVVERIPADSTAWEQQKVAQRGLIAGTIQQQRLQQWIEGLRARSTIIDRRREVSRLRRRLPISRRSPWSSSAVSQRSGSRSAHRTSPDERSRPGEPRGALRTRPNQSLI